MTSLQPLRSPTAPELKDVKISNGAFGNVAEIVAWQNAANRITDNPAEKSDLVSRIEGLVGKTRHKGTVSYGLRVLSGFGYDREALLEMALVYNERVSDDTLDRDSPTISRFYAEFEPHKYTPVNVE